MIRTQFNDSNLFNGYSHWPRWCGQPAVRESTTDQSYIEDLKSVLSYYGLWPEEIDELIAVGVTSEKIEELLSDAGLLSGVIRIGASEIALHHTLLPVLEQFRKQYPGVRLRIFNSNTHQAVRVLKERLVDLSLVTTPFEEQRDLVCRTLAEFQDAAVCAGAYAHLAQRTITAAELTEYPLISLGKGTATHQLYTQWFHGHGLVIAPDIEAATADQILPMVRSNLGIGFVPEHTAQKAAADGEIYILNIRQPLPRRSICLLKRRDTPLSAAARALETMILQHCQGGKCHDQ